MQNLGIWGLMGAGVKIRHRKCHHGLYGVVYANGQSNGERRFSTTHSGKTTGPILIKLEI